MIPLILYTGRRVCEVAAFAVLLSPGSRVSWIPGYLAVLERVSGDESPYFPKPPPPPFL